MALRQKFLVVGFLAAIPIVPMLILGALILTTQEGRAAPAAITGLIATDASYARHGQIDLAWNPSNANDFAYYSVYVAETEITDVAELSPIDRIDGRADVTYQVTRYEVSGLTLALFAFTKDTEYWFAVTAVDVTGNESKIETSVSAIIEKMPPAPTVFIRVNNTGFESEAVTVPVGTTIAWTNISTINRNRLPGTNLHTVTSDTGLFSGDLTSANDILTYTFTEAGIFGYHCEFHVSETGTVIVVE